MVLLSTCQSGGPRELRPLPGRKRVCLHLSPLNVRVSHVWFSPERWARRRQHRAPHRLCLFRRQRRDPPAIWGASEPAAPGGRGASALPQRGARGEDGESPQSQPAPTSASSPSPAVPLQPPAPRPARHLGGFRTCGPRRAGRICLAARRSQGRRRRVFAIPTRALTAHPRVSVCAYVSCSSLLCPAIITKQRSLVDDRALHTVLPLVPDDSHSRPLETRKLLALCWPAWMAVRRRDGS